MRNSFSAILVYGGLISTLGACGAAGSHQDPDALTPASLKASAKPAEKSADDEAKAREQAPAEGEAASAAPAAEEDAIRKPSRPPLDLIAAPNVLFIFNFAESEAGIAAKERCEQESGDDPRESRACIEKARSKVPVESVRFSKDEQGNWWWVTYNRYKGNLLKWHRIQFLPGEETPNSIVLKPMGKDKGVAPMARVPRTLTIDLPNDYSIVVNDREHGKMVYDAKIGVLERE